MKFSIVLATLNRSELVKKSIQSIINQTYNDFEIIVIDQSNDHQTELVVKSYKYENRILYFKVNFKGLSKARNFGICNSTGNYICLMDDDAEYDNEFLERAQRLLSENNYDVLSGIIKEKSNGRVFIPLMNNISKKMVDYSSVSLCPSASLIINKSIMLKEVGLFDEKLGAGQYFGAGEETDLLFRFLENNRKIFYTDSLIVYHPYPVSNFNEFSIKRAYSYALGEGALCKKFVKSGKHKIIFIKRFSKNIIKSTIAVIIYSFNKNKRDFYFNRLTGLIRGFIEYN